MERTYRVHTEIDQDGFYIVTVPSVPGVVEQGTTEDEAIERLQDSLDLLLTDAVESGEQIPESDPIDHTVNVHVMA